MRRISRANWLDLESFKDFYEIEKVVDFHHRPNDDLQPTPLVSVVVITYQHKDYIDFAIRSVLNQKIDFPIEIIIGDDGSTDGTTEICKEYARQYPSLIRLLLHSRGNVRRILGKPCGIFQVMYNLLSCRGKYIALLSGDDEWISNQKLIKQVEYLEHHDKCSLVWIPKHFCKRTEDGIETSETNAVYPYPSGCMYRNVFRTLPKEMIQVLNEDDFLRAICHLYGFEAILTDAGEVRIHVTGSNLWAGTDVQYKIDQQVNTAKAIYSCLKSSDSRAIRAYARKLNMLSFRRNHKKILMDLARDPLLALWYMSYRIKNVFSKRVEV